MPATNLVTETVTQDESARTTAAPKRRQLGRGLSALLGDDYPEDGAGGAAPSGGEGKATQTLPIGDLAPGPFQPRQVFDDEEMAALTESVRRHGVLQPIIVRREPGNPGRYQIIAGERRWRAAQRAKLHDVPVVVREIDDHGALEIGLVENLQRQDLNPLEEAGGYRRLIEEFSYTQEQLGDIIGRSRSHIANMMRLLALPGSVKSMVEDGRLTAGHARALLTAERPGDLANEIVAKGLNVRQAEALAQQPKSPKRASGRPVPDANTAALEQELTDALGLKVGVRHGGAGGGTVTVRYKTLEQLDELVARLMHRAGHSNDR